MSELDDYDERGRENHTSGEYLSDEAAQILLARMLQMIPPCPDCEGKTCAEWLLRYFSWIMTAMLGPSGFMCMFIACLEREGGRIEFTRDEIINAGKVLKVENEVKFDNSTTTAIIRERADSVPEEGSYWPDFIN